MFSRAVKTRDDGSTNRVRFVDFCGLGVCKSYFLVMSSMCSPWCNWLMRSLTFSCVVFTIVLSIIELYLGLVYFVCLVHDYHRCPFVCFFEVCSRINLFFNSFRVLTSLRDRLFLGLIILISASCVVTFSK